MVVAIRQASRMMVEISNKIQHRLMPVLAREMVRECWMQMKKMTKRLLTLGP